MDHLVGASLCAVDLPFVIPKIPEGSDRALLIVETRPSFFLPRVVATAVKTHPGWRLYVFGTPAVHALLDSACKNYEDATRVTLNGGPRMTTTQYSRLLLSDSLWDIVREEHVLVFQSDCVLVRPTPDAMLAYDFVGAVCGSFTPGRFVMNGGLSLRRRSAMRRAIRAIRTTRPDLLDEPEDVALCAIMRASGDFTLPSYDTCDDFAIESTGNPDTAVGMHGTDKYYAPPHLVARLLGVTAPPS